jgi:flagellar protein FlgJ
MVSPLNSLTTHVQKADARLEASPEQRKAAQDFEAIFLRQLMKGLEKGSGFGQSEGSGSQIYRSMMVDTFADSAAQGGGIGLSDLVLQALLTRGGAQAP